MPDPCQENSKFNPCGKQDRDPKRPDNRPALDEIEYRIGRHPDFLDRMLWNIPRTEVNNPETGVPEKPLENLSVRTNNDPTIALLDAWASTLDVLTFYQERIANEGYLRTAQERMSALELARSIGLELSPGVAASAYLAFSVENSDDPFRMVEVPVGTQIMSVPQEKDELPQIFETTELIEARAEWNDIPAQTQRAQYLVLYENTNDSTDEDNGKLYLIDIDNSFNFDSMVGNEDEDISADDLITIDSNNLSNYLAVTPGLDLATAIADLEADAALNTSINPVIQGIEIDYAQINGTGLGFSEGDRVIAVGVRATEDENADPEVSVSPFRILATESDTDYDLTRIDLVPIGKDAPVRRNLLFRFSQPKFRKGVVQTERISFSATSALSNVKRASWSGTALSAFVRTQNWSRVKLMQFFRQSSSVIASEPGAVQQGLYVLRQKAGFFGNTAPKWETLPIPDETRGSTTGNDPYEYPWEPGGIPRTIWRNSQGDVLTEDKGEPHVYLEREIEEVIPDGWALLETSGGTTEVLRVTDILTETRADYTISAKTTGLKFANPDGTSFNPLATEMEVFKFRTATAYVASEAIELAGLPILEKLDEGADELTLDSLYLDLEEGRAITLGGERDDAPDVGESESLTLKTVSHSGGYTRLKFEHGTEVPYKRTSIRVNANVAMATHGEAVSEVLGSGDATAPNQAFALAKTPLTFVAADNERGLSSTLVMRVNGIEWAEVESLYEATSEDEVYLTRIDDDSKTRVVFGDGVHGKRLPTGTNNIVAEYRAGMGTEGEVAEETLIQLKTRPLGIRSVFNASAASGSAPASTLDEVRTLAPDSVRTLGRVVSFSDYQNFAFSFAGIGKAHAILLWQGNQQVIHVTVAPTTDSEFDADAPTLQKLRNAIESLRDPGLPLEIDPHQPRFFTLSAKVACDPRYILEDVELVVRDMLETHFSYAARDIAQPVSAAEVISKIQSVDGVVFVDLDALQVYQEDVEVAALTLSSVLIAKIAYVTQDEQPEIIGAELLSILDAGIELNMEVADVQS